MAEKIKIRISQKNDTTARWGSSSLVLNLGEIGIERKTDGTCAMKIGDGVKTWSQLPYLEANAADVPDWAKSDIPVDQSTGNGFIKTVTVSDNHVSFERANLAVSNGTAESGKYISEISVAADGTTVNVVKADIPAESPISITGGEAEEGKYISSISATGHSVTVTKTDIPDVAVSASGTGNVIGSISADGHTITATKVNAVLPNGSVPFTAPQAGVDPTASNHLVTKKYVDDTLGSLNGAMRFKGTLGTGGDVETLPTEGVQIGDTYRVVVEGTYGGHQCEIGDLLIAIDDDPVTWTAAQTNIDGAVVGTGSNGQVAVFTANNHTVSGQSFNSLLTADESFKDTVKSVAAEVSADATDVTVTLTPTLSDSTTGTPATFNIPAATNSAKGVVVVDTALSASPNPIANAAVNTALAGKANAQTVTAVAAEDLLVIKHTADGVISGSRAAAFADLPITKENIKGLVGEDYLKSSVISAGYGISVTDKTTAGAHTATVALDTSIVYILDGGDSTDSV